MEALVIALFAALALALAVDWLQTRKIVSNPDRWQELNPIIDRFFKKNPWIYFLIWLVLFAFLSFWLRDSVYGVLVLAFALGNQVHCIWRNWMEGIRV